MRSIFIAGVLLFTGMLASAQDKQEMSETTKQQLENLADAGSDDPEDDSNLQLLDHYRKHPININTANAEELAALNLLSGLQVQQLLAYRKLLGLLINPYELQAIPSWDIATIKKIFPFIVVADNKSLAEKLGERWKGGDNKLLLRSARVLEKSKGYDLPATAGTSYYLGNRDKYLLRYSYNYKNLLQWGLLAGKDAGEQFFKGSQRQGFDFYSVHFFARKLGVIKALAIGDYTVNLGQGLLQWQALAFKKNADAMAVKRQSAVLRPYNAAGEYNFHRGIGITLQKRNWEGTLFASFRKISASQSADSITGDGIVSSFITSGYHRTAAENAGRNSLGQLAVGGNLKYQGSNWHAGFNAIHYHFSKPVQKSADPYHLYALQGSELSNASFDYSYTWRNVHFFGEAAADSKFSKAFLSGALVSVDKNIDVSVVYRNIQKDYVSVNANAFTENAYPVNENGFYTGVSVRPVAGLRLDAYADLFRFPWLKYRVDAASQGKDFLVQLNYTPNKQVEMYARYKSETKMSNQAVDTLAAAVVAAVPKKDLRLQTTLQISRQFSLANRLELLWYNGNAPDAGQGFLGNMDASYKPAHAAWSSNLRLQYFETSGYNERIYTYETGLPYNFSIPFFYGKGFRYYFNFDCDAGQLFGKSRKKKRYMDIGFRWAQTVYSNSAVIGSGLDEINGNKLTEIKVQLIMIF